MPLIKLHKSIIILETAINDEVIAQLKTVDYISDDIKAAILAYQNDLIEKGVEIFDTGDDFIVCEDGLYIAVYEDEVDPF